MKTRRLRYDKTERARDNHGRQEELRRVEKLGTVKDRQTDTDNTRTVMQGRRRFEVVKDIVIAPMLVSAVGKKECLDGHEVQGVTDVYDMNSEESVD